MGLSRQQRNKQRPRGSQRSPLPRTVADKQIEVRLSSADRAGIRHVVVTHGDKIVQAGLA